MEVLKECLDTGCLVRRCFVERFERDLAAYVGTNKRSPPPAGQPHCTRLCSSRASTGRRSADLNSHLYRSCHAIVMPELGLSSDCRSDHWQMDAQKVVSFLEEDASGVRATENRLPEAHQSNSSRSHPRSSGGHEPISRGGASRIGLS